MVIPCSGFPVEVSIFWKQSKSGRNGENQKSNESAAIFVQVLEVSSISRCGFVSSKSRVVVKTRHTVISGGAPSRRLVAPGGRAPDGQTWRGLGNQPTRTSKDSLRKNYKIVHVLENTTSCVYPQVLLLKGVFRTVLSPCSAYCRS